MKLKNIIAVGFVATGLLVGGVASANSGTVDPIQVRPSQFASTEQAPEPFMLANLPPVVVEHSRSEDTTLHGAGGKRINKKMIRKLKNYFYEQKRRKRPKIVNNSSPAGNPVLSG